MPKILIPAAPNTSTLGFARGYRSLGWDVSLDVETLFSRKPGYDAVHYQWPEEYCGWQTPPDRARMDEIEECLKWWSERARCIFTAHNLFPHVNGEHPSFRRLYSLFYRYSHVVSHYSETSRRLVLAEFPEASQCRHLVHHLESSELQIECQTERGDRRTELGIAKDEFVILMLGQLRSWNEIRLIMSAIDRAKVHKKRLLIAEKIFFPVDSWRMRARLWRWRRWLKRQNAVVDRTWIPESEISRLVNSCDVMIVPRAKGLNSAIVFLGMGLGRMIIAPNCGAYPEQLAGTRNLLFKAGDALDLALRLEEAAMADTVGIGKENAEIAAKWTWENICRALLSD